MLNYKKLLLITSIFITSFVNAMHYHGAGVLPYAKNPKDNRIYFLFSREAFGQAKGTWADFGGKADKKDKNNPRRIAAREFVEESAGLYFKQINVAQAYLAKATMQNNPYALFFAKVPFNRFINKKFQYLRSKAKTLHQKEKDNLIWIPRPKLRYALLTNNRNIMLANGKVITLRACTFKFLKNSLSKINNLK